jgi:hypothetical protein
MLTFKQGNALKAVGLLVALVGVVLVMMLGPTFSEPERGPDIITPSMQNVPPTDTVMRVE